MISPDEAVSYCLDSRKSPAEIRNMLVTMVEARDAVHYGRARTAASDLKRAIERLGNAEQYLNGVKGDLNHLAREIRRV